ncbi:thiamine-phosphate kinase [Pseudomonas syringae pv. tomato]|uniref:Thiamine-monophosphate kinase n=4 Tax=Pseudomonas syringae group genomosp. 3 TaxID=251701 RepID=Q889Q4_PSESM|nr:MULTISPECIES: thiamine-phosphate kinase [Pseudomonas]KPC07451.1 Thiamine-monophosphate kinase [Pseudomonas amygdali pv. lachrymans]AAO54237.1 thiamine monophosphate kinase [Pseudomonas syringae pv. tomato str. DC3000]KKI27429.1 thiamine monophosphate kinase [Pseudomonas syringae pv. persicae]KPB83428.1 Thiamine-monophosphate kinase [Pseudomonas syringae pv. maculicola]KPB96358.1 Thiamine-monophosphate kinase [Pseudomonas syringae pv. maculicola]
MGEFELIRNYFAAAPCAQAGEEVVLGIGDDCALLALPPGEQLAISTDTLVADVHFPAVCDPFLLGQRALAVSASDLAAMGARPVAFTLALTLPHVDADWLQRFAHGLSLMAQGCSLRLIGGDTTRGPLSLTLTVFGAVPSGLALTRSGARVGDLLCVGGALGDGAAALPLVLNQRSAEASIAEPLLARYWSPQPQLALGQALRGKATSALDISDGLLADCGHIARASGVRLLIERDGLPMSPHLLALFDLQAAQQAALSGGDDYVLAFTLPPEHLAGLLDAGWPVHVIGRVEAGNDVVLIDHAGADITPDTRGYQHFGGPQ